MKYFNRIAFRSCLLLGFMQLAVGCGNQESMHFKKGELLYDKTIPTALVQQVGQALQADSIFNDSKATTAKLEKKDSLYVVSIVFDTTKLTPLASNELHGMAIRYSQDLFGAAPLDMVLMDEYQKPLVTYQYRSPGTQIKVKDARLFYSKAVPASNATKLMDYLTKINFAGEDFVMALDKQADGYHLQLISKLTETPTPAIQADFSILAKAWSTTAFNGAPLTIELCHYDMKTFWSTQPSPAA